MKTFLIILAVALVGLGTWWFFGSGQSYTLLGTAPLSSRDGLTHPAVAADVSIVSSNIITKATQEVTARAQQSLNYATSSVAAALANTEAIVSNAAKGVVDNAFENVVGAGGNFLGITNTASSSENSGNATSSATGLCQNNNGVICILMDSIVNIGQPISFTVDGLLFSENNVQEIDAYVSWGDGVNEYQKLYATSGDYALTHTFTTSGTYQSLFTFDIGTSTIQYKIKIVVQQ